MGCQRSGTSITGEAFGKIKGVASFRETNSAITSHDTSEKDHTIRLNSFESVNETFQGVKDQYIVAKPLVESQRALDLLAAFPTARILWMFRNPADVVASMKKKWGDDIGFLELNAAFRGGMQNWRSQNIPPHERALYRALSGVAGENEAAGLFWYIRNSAYFRQQLGEHPRVIPLQYERLMSAPATFRTLLNWLDFPNPDVNWAQMFNQSSIGAGRDVTFDEPFDELFTELLVHLQAEDRRAWNDLETPVSQNVTAAAR